MYVQLILFVEQIRKYFKEKFNRILPYGDTKMTLFNTHFFPLHLLSYNIKGAVSVIGWAGVSMIISSLES